MKLKPVEEQVVVVFGASSGIGRETARRFAQRGARVVVSARGEPGLNTLVDEIRAEGGEATAVPADATNYEQVKAVADRAAELYGGLDTWAHLAAVSIYATFEQTTPEEFKQVIDTNLTGQAYGAMAALPHLRRRGGGALIHVSSVEAKRALPLQSAYAASKHGVAGFLSALRLELRREGVPISVTNIMPSTINTPLFSHARTKLGVQPKGIAPFYAPAAVAKAIVHAAEHPVRDLVVGEAGRMLIAGNSLAPRLIDAALLAIGFRGQRTDQPKGADAPNNLFHTLETPGQVEGEFGRQVQPSPYTWLQLNPVARWALTGSLLGGALLLLRRSARHG